MSKNYITSRRFWHGGTNRNLRRFVPIISSSGQRAESMPISGLSRRVQEPPWTQAWWTATTRSFTQWRNPRRPRPITEQGPTAGVMKRPPAWNWEDFRKESPWRNFYVWRNPRRFMPRTESSPSAPQVGMSRRIATPPWTRAWWKSSIKSFTEWRNPRRFLPIVSTEDLGPLANLAIIRRRLPWRWELFKPGATGLRLNRRRFMPRTETVDPNIVVPVVDLVPDAQVPRWRGDVELTLLARGEQSLSGLGRPDIEYTPRLRAPIHPTEELPET